MTWSGCISLWLTRARARVRTWSQAGFSASVRFFNGWTLRIHAFIVLWFSCFIRVHGRHVFSTCVMCEDTVLAEDPISPSEGASMPSQTDDSLEGLSGSGMVWLFRIFRGAVLSAPRLSLQVFFPVTGSCLSSLDSEGSEGWPADPPGAM